MPNSDLNRRPIAARSWRWTQSAASFLARSSVTPNQISVVSIVFAAVGATLLVFKPDALGLIGCALAIQGRLICNLLDGMVAIEGGKKSAVGAIYNEFPDRVADSLLIVALGYSIGWPALGWFGALAAALIAYIRVFGGSLGLPQDYRGPMAKQQRMAVLTAACVAGAAEHLLTGTQYALLAAAVIIAVGSVVTCVVRTRASPPSSGSRSVWLSYVLIASVRVLFGATPHWIGSAPEPQQRIYFANHTSHIDTVALWSALPPDLRTRTRTAAAADYWGADVLKRTIALKALNAVLIDRRRADPAADPLQPLYEVMETGQSLIIFPEGTRMPQALPGPFKSGLFHLARRFPDVELIPVYLDNLHRSLPKGTLFPVPLICTVRFGAPLARIADEDKSAFLERARNAVIGLAT